MKKIIKCLMPSLFFLLLLACNNVPNEVIDDQDNIIQVNIKWPSLGDTPWPMQHHDPQSTGRSAYKGPQLGILEKKVYVGISESGISIGYNGLVVLGTSYTPYDFFALDYYGNIKWKTNAICLSTPLVSSDSSIFFAGENMFSSYKNTGDLLWQKNIDKMISVGINIDKEGNLYFIDFNNTLTVLDKQGNIKWKLKDDRFLRTSDATPTFSPDGQTLYVQGNTVSVLAVDINNRIVKWFFGDKEQLSSPVIDNAGNIYIIPGGLDLPKERKLYSLNPGGQINWEYSFVASVLWDNTEPTIDYNGNIYFGADTLYSLTNSGKFRWKKSLNGSLIVSPLVCDIDNVVYIATMNPTVKENKIISVKENGEIKWTLTDTEERQLGVSAAITENGMMLFPTWDNANGNYLIIN